MNTNQSEKISEYVQLLQELKKAVGDSESASLILHELAKDRRMEIIRAERREASNGVLVTDDAYDEPATFAQKKYMHALNIVVPPGVTKRWASQLIDEALGKEAA